MDWSQQLDYVKLYDWIGRKVLVSLHDGEEHIGHLYNVDPTTNVIFLYIPVESPKDDKLIIIMPHAVVTVALIDDENALSLEQMENAVSAGFQFQEPNPISLSLDQKDRLKQWLINRGILVKEKEDALCLFGDVEIARPFLPDSIKAKSGVLVERTRRLLFQSPICKVGIITFRRLFCNFHANMNLSYVCGNLKQSVCLCWNVSQSIHALRPSITGQRRNYNILYFGSDQFSVQILDLLLKEKEKTPSIFSTIDVVTPPDKPVGLKKILTPVPVKKFCLEKGLKVLDAPPKSLKNWTFQNSGTSGVANPAYDIGVVVSFGYFLPSRILKLFPKGTINVHPSLLPKYRGASPIQFTLLNSDLEGGVSIMELDSREFDAGRILKQSKLQLPPNPFYSELEGLLAVQGGNDLICVLQQLESFRKNAWLQDELKATHAPKIKKSLGYLNFSTMDSQSIFKIFRAVGHKIPMKAAFRGSGIHLLDLVPPCSVPKEICTYFITRNSPPGTLFYDHQKETLYFQCAHQTSLGCRILKREGRKATTAKDFYNGYHIFNGVECLESFL